MTQEFTKASTLVLCISSIYEIFSILCTVLVRVQISCFNISLNNLICIVWIFETLETVQKVKVKV